MERAKHSFLLCLMLYISCLVMNKICLNQILRLCPSFCPCQVISLIISMGYLLCIEIYIKRDLSRIIHSFVSRTTQPSVRSFNMATPREISSLFLKCTKLDCKTRLHAQSKKIHSSKQLSM